jgi:hypothetical protein
MIGGLIGNLFSGSDKTKTASADSALTLRGSSSDHAAKPKPVVYRTASTPAPKTAANAAPEPAEKPTVKQATAEPQGQAASDARAAYAAPPAPPAPQTNGMLTGAQPVMPAGNFDSRWSGFR